MSQAAILEENTILKATDVEFPSRPPVSSEAKVSKSVFILQASYKKIELERLENLFKINLLSERKWGGEVGINIQIGKKNKQGVWNNTG